MNIPLIGLGTWPLRGAECEAAVGSALELGYRHIDTAEMYGNEVEIGRAIGGAPRGDLFITSKAWWDKPDGPAIRAACEASLARLRTPYLDLFLIHWPSPVLQLASALEGLAGLQRDGLARAVGVANFPPGLLRQALALNIAPIACNQVEHHLYLDQSRLLELCAAHDIVLTSYTPLAKGRFLDDAVVARIAARHGATPGQVALAWALSRGRVAVIPKAAGRARQAENLGAAKLVLDADDVTALAALPKDRRLVNPDFAPDWQA
ncbi:MAG: aldo/keto reductase [Alphaproteobacteria bacterium]|nr:aldo/keto reductase [Alphaproteobacteria bacterium]